MNFQNISKPKIIVILVIAIIFLLLLIFIPIKEKQGPEEEFEVIGAFDGEPPLTADPIKPGEIFFNLGGVIIGKRGKNIIAVKAFDQQIIPEEEIREVIINDGAIIQKLVPVEIDASGRVKNAVFKKASINDLVVGKKVDISAAKTTDIRKKGAFEAEKIVIWEF